MRFILRFLLIQKFYLIGTFDVSVLVMTNGIFEVKTFKGDSHLGGDLVLLGSFVFDCNL